MVSYLCLLHVKYSFHGKNTPLGEGLTLYPILPVGNQGRQRSQGIARRSRLAEGLCRAFALALGPLPDGR